LTISFAVVDTPTVTETPTVTPTATLTATQTPTATLTDTPTATETSTTTPTDTPTATETPTVTLTDTSTATETSTTTPTDTPTPTPSSGSGTGLQGEYFSQKDLTQLVLTRTDAVIDFNWGTGSPASEVPNNRFSVRWTGQVEPLYSETYTFYTVSDDGVRLWVNDQLLIDNWTDHSAREDSGTIDLVAGERYDIRLEYYENGGKAVARLRWSSDSQVKEVVPQSQLHPPAP
jgi:hypothetical protein